MSQLSAEASALAPMPVVTVADIQRRVSDAAYGKPLVTNVLRGYVAEAIVAAALEPVWRWCSADYASWDFERADGVRLEVKQSAELQSWATKPRARPVATFDIAHRQGRYQNDIWIGEPGRAADIYVLAHHDVTDTDADHRDPAQWTFYVAPTKTLPPTKRIAIGSVRKLVPGCRFDTLAERVAATAA